MVWEGANPYVRICMGTSRDRITGSDRECDINMQQKAVSKPRPHSPTDTAHGLVPGPGFLSCVQTCGTGVHGNQGPWEMRRGEPLQDTAFQKDIPESQNAR